MTYLLQAARDGLLDIVESHIAMSAQSQIHTFDEDGYTALHHAARYNRIKVLDALINAGGGKYTPPCCRVQQDQSTGCSYQCRWM